MPTLSCDKVDSSFTITWMDNFAKPTYILTYPCLDWKVLHGLYHMLTFGICLVSDMVLLLT